MLGDPATDYTLFGDQIIELDWRAYFMGFQAVHGGEPIYYEPLKRLLFRDGWTYALDIRGPEWPPPSDPRQAKELIQEYWRLRRIIINTKLVGFKRTIADLEEIQKLRSAPIQRKVKTRDETGRIISQPDTLDFVSMQNTVEVLQSALDECDLNLD